MPLEIKLVQDSEYHTVNDFFNQTRFLNGSSKKRIRSFHEFRWEYFEAPDRLPIFAGAWDVEDRTAPILIGIQGMIIHTLKSSDGRSFLAAKGEDSVIDIPAFRKFPKTDILKDLLDLLVKECRNKGVECIWGMNELPATFRRLDYETPFKSCNMILVLNPVRAYRDIIALRSENQTLNKLKIGTLSLISYLHSLKKSVIFHRQKNYKLNFEIQGNTSLFQRASSHSPLFFLNQNDDYLKWRISENPYPVKYKSFQLLGPGNTLIAQVICSIYNHSSFIEQTLFDQSLERKIILSFLSKIIKCLEKEKVFLVRFIAFKNNDLNRREMGLFKRAGFVLTGNGEWFRFKSLAESPVITPNSIYLSRLYKQGRT